MYDAIEALDLEFASVAELVQKFWVGYEFVFHAPSFERLFLETRQGRRISNAPQSRLYESRTWFKVELLSA